MDDNSSEHLTPVLPTVGKRSKDSQPFPQPRKPRVLRKRSAEERARLLALLERSGLTHKQFCREHEVAPSTITFWLRQARRSAGVW
jgi:transposase-like protein